MIALLFALLIDCHIFGYVSFDGSKYLMDLEYNCIDKIKFGMFENKLEIICPTSLVRVELPLIVNFNTRFSYRCGQSRAYFGTEAIMVSLETFEQTKNN
jgi:hypothetical protein